MMRRTLATIAIVLASATLAHAGADAPIIDARVRCAHPAEDSMAHLHMTRYHTRGDGTIVVAYRCKRRGY